MRADAMTDLLRHAWDPRRRPQEPGDEAEAPRAAYALQLDAGAAAGMAGMTLLDILTGKYQSRVPGMNVTQRNVSRPYWAAWDPCSKYRSRCVLLVVQSLSQKHPKCLPRATSLSTLCHCMR
jgi:hypothetical protein